MKCIRTIVNTQAASFSKIDLCQINKATLFFLKNNHTLIKEVMFSINTSKIKVMMVHWTLSLLLQTLAANNI